MKRITFVTITLGVWIVFLPQAHRQLSAGVSKKESSTDAQLAEDAREKQQAAQTAALDSILATIAKNEQERTDERQQEASDEKATIRAEWWLVYLGIAQAIALIGTLIAVCYQTKKTAEATQAMRDSVPLQ